MAQAVSRRLPTAEVRVRSRASPSGICGGQKWQWDRFFPQYFGFPTGAPLLGKGQKIIIVISVVIFITGCDRSVCCGALLHKKKKKTWLLPKLPPKGRLLPVLTAGHPCYKATHVGDRVFLPGFLFSPTSTIQSMSHTCISFIYHPRYTVLPTDSVVK
jgi:hypothetical protein